MAVSNSIDRFNGLIASLAIKAPCVAVAVANITLSGEQTVNGVAVVSGDRVLVIAQTSAVDNGIYDVSSGAWARSADFDGNRDIVSGTFVTVATASVGRNPYYQVTTANPITIGTTAINFTLADGPNVSYPLTPIEDAAGLTDNDIDDSYEPGDVPRYGENTNPGTTDMHAAGQIALGIASNVSGGDAYKTDRFKVAFPWNKYKITRPLEISGDNLHIDGCGSTIIKSTDDIPTTTHPVIAVTGDNVDPNVNAIFVTTTKLRFSTIENFHLEGLSGSSTPEGIWLVGNENTFRNIWMREISVGFHALSAWTTILEQIKIRESTSHSFWWDATREVGTGQSGTSIHFDNCFAISPGGKGFYLHDCDYPTFSACACDDAVEEAYWFRGCSGISGGIAWERMDATSTTAALRFSAGSSGNLSIDSFDDTNFSQAAILATESIVTLSGRLRTDNDDFIDISTASYLNLDTLDIDPITGSVTNARFVTADTSTYTYRGQITGDFTPTILIGGSATGVTYSSQDAKYTRLGNRVFFDLILVLTSKNSLTGDVVIAGLPFSVGDYISGTSLEAGASVTFFQGLSTSVADLKGMVNTSEQVALFFVAAGGGTACTALNGTDISDTFFVRISGSYTI